MKIMANKFIRETSKYVQVSENMEMAMPDARSTSIHENPKRHALDT